MKKLLALTLLVVHLFNLTGYTLLFTYLGQQAAEDFTNLIDKESFNDADLVEIKVSLNLPYITSWGSYERHEGEITIDGKHHNYVKRKVSGDTLYLLCLPNTYKDNLQAAETSFGNDANDLGSKSDQPQVKKAMVFNQYQIQDIEYSISSTAEHQLKNYPIVTSSIIDPFIDKNCRPPRS